MQAMLCIHNLLAKGIFFLTFCSIKIEICSQNHMSKLLKVVTHQERGTRSNLISFHFACFHFSLSLSFSLIHLYIPQYFLRLS